MVRIRGMLLTLLDIMELPPNPLDQLTDLMGGEEKVAEMTGRKGMLKREADGTVSYQRRCAEVSHCMCILLSAVLCLTSADAQRSVTACVCSCLRHCVFPVQRSVAACA